MTSYLQLPYKSDFEASFVDKDSFSFEDACYFGSQEYRGMIVFEHFIRVGEFNATPRSAIIVGPAVLLIFHNYSVQSYDIFKYRGIDTIGPSPHDPQVSNCKHAIVAVDLAI